MGTPPGQHLGHAVRLAKVSPLNELDFQPSSPGQRHSAIPARSPQGFGEQAQIETTNIGEGKLPLQSGGMTHVPQAAGDDHAVKTTQRSSAVRRVTGYK